MTQVDNCPRCGRTETTKHLLWECEHVKKIWMLYNEIIVEGEVNAYDEVFKFGYSESAIIIKIKLIQELIQIDRPKNWTKNKIIEMINNLINIEKYNAIKEGSIPKFTKRWTKYFNL